jgi:hypothetical protein
LAELSGTGEVLALRCTAENVPSSRHWGLAVEKVAAPRRRCQPHHTPGLLFRAIAAEASTCLPDRSAILANPASSARVRKQFRDARSLKPTPLLQSSGRPQQGEKAAGPSAPVDTPVRAPDWSTLGSPIESCLAQTSIAAHRSNPASPSSTLLSPSDGRGVRHWDPTQSHDSSPQTSIASARLARIRR